MQDLKNLNEALSGAKDFTEKFRVRCGVNDQRALRVLFVMWLEELLGIKDGQLEEKLCKAENYADSHRVQYGVEDEAALRAIFVQHLAFLLNANGEVR